jgi:hypothetical protein
MGWVVRYALRMMMPSGGELPGVEDTHMVTYLRQLRREAPFTVRLGLVLGSWLFVFGPILTIFVPLPAFLLSRNLREKHAQRAAVHRFYLFRQAVLLVKMFAGLCWGRDPNVRARFEMAPLDPDPGTWREGP